jgi:serine/threonine protein kinase/tetratricopeptide (TPR) repeat protein
MGDVYRARDTRLRRDVAMKILPAALVADEDRAARFEEEARAGAALNHPNIVAVYDVGQHDGTPYLVTELLEGETLRQKCARHGVPFEKALHYARQIADGLAAAHARHIVHRDIKPENVFVLPDDRVKILDFGIARQLTDGGPAEAPTMFEGGAIVGTPGYMAPEQVRGLPADARADVFSFGVVLYELLAGARAFDRESPFETMAATVTDDPRGLVALEGSLPTNLASLLRRCLAKSAEARPSQMGEVVALLAAINRQTPAAPPPPTIAVLPFADISAGKDNEYFCDGIAEELCNALARVPGLRVASRTSSFQFKGSTSDITTIAQRLNVSSILEGSVRKSQDRLRIAVQLVKADTGHQLWAETFDRTMNDVFAVQEEIARTVVAALRVTLGASSPLVPDRPADVAAYTLYLRGRHHWNRRTFTDVVRSIEYFRQALAIDPGYAQAHAGLADAHLVLGAYGLNPPQEAMASARESAQQALAIAPNSPQALTVLANVRCLYEWAWVDSETTFRRAIAVDPQYATSHHWYAINLLAPLGRFREATEHIAHALRLDPLSLPINATQGVLAYYSGDFDATVTTLQGCLELDPAFVLARNFLGLAHSQQGRHAEAIDTLERAVDLSGGLESQAALGFVQARAGLTREANEALESLRKKAIEQYVSPLFIAPILTVLGNRSGALEMLELACHEHTPALVWIKQRPVYRTFAGDPRFVAITRQMGLTD